MKKMWRVIVAIVLVLILIGLVAVAVGFLTGADTARIYQTAENSNLINLILRYFDWFVQVVQTYKAALFGA
jgi:hypothetical protein